jgi:hypothetical protein
MIGNVPRAGGVRLGQGIVRLIHQVSHQNAFVIPKAADDPVT